MGELPSSKRRRLGPEPNRQRPPQVILNDLPEELIEEIAYYLNTILPKKDFGKEHFGHPIKKTWRPRYLHAFSLVSKKFHRIATPLLYSIFVEDNQPAVLHQFVLTIMRNSDLAACVRTVVIGDFGTDEQDVLYPLEIECSNEARAEIIGRASKIDFGDKQRDRRWWLECLDDELHDAEISFLLTQTPNLETLDLETGRLSIESLYFCTTTLIGLAASVGEVNNTQGLFTNLRHVILRDTFSTELSEYDPPEHEFQWILSLPSLRTLELYGIFWQSPRESKFVDRSSSIETLIIRETAMCPTLFRNLVRACREIKHLVYEFGGEDWEYAEVDADVLYDTLLFHKDYLETLILETPLVEFDLPYISPMGSFKDFRRMRLLRVCGLFLFENLDPEDLPSRSDSVLGLIGHGRSLCENFFPQSLQTLCIDLTSIQSDRVGIIFHVIADILKGRSDSWLRDLHSLQFTITPTMWNQDENSKEWSEKFCNAGIFMMDCGVEEYMIHVVPQQMNLKAAKIMAYSLRKDQYGNGKTMAAGQMNS